MKTLSAICICPQCATLGLLALVGSPGAREAFEASQATHVIAGLATMGLATVEESSEGYTDRFEGWTSIDTSTEGN